MITETITLKKEGDSYFAPISNELLEQLGWQVGDSISIETVVVLNDDGDEDGIVLTKINNV